LALAATVLVTFTLTLTVFERESGLDATAPKAPRAGRPAKVSPAEATRADQPAKSPPAELQSAVPEPATPGPQAAPGSDGVRQPTAETALSGERRATGQPARGQVVPRGVEILRKSEDETPLSDAQRVFDAQQQITPRQAPAAAAPAPGTNIPRESASALQGAGTASGVASRLAAPEAKERSAEKWIEDIRKLKTESKAAEAERELAEFRKRYPDYRLPEDLR
jgi:hypothetical protein